MLRKKNIPRSTLFIAAAVGLVLMYASDFLPLYFHHPSICKGVGGFLFFAALFVVMTRSRKSGTPSSTSKKATAICCITAGFLLLTGLFLHTSPWLHRLIGLSALGLFFICWSLPRSRWTELTMLPIFVMTLMQIGWKEFSTVASIRPATLVAMLLVWAALVFLAFRLIDKRKFQPHVELH